jgi:hypothetical protein
MTPYSTVGMRINPTLYCQALVPIRMAMMPPTTSPPGQPACRMFSHLVFSRLNTVATTGLMTASTVPFPSATMNVPM